MFPSEVRHECRGPASVRLGHGSDLVLGGRRFAIKAGARGVDALYRWLGDGFGLVVAADREEPLLVLRLGDFLRACRFRESENGTQRDAR